MDWQAFTPWSALIGGALIGLAVSFFLFASGRIAGISGIAGGLFTPRPGDFGWRLAFVGGLLLTGLVAAALFPATVTASPARSGVAMVVAGLVVGYSTRLGNGCTSGHGVCGLSRFSVRSLVATLTFMATGIGTATLIRVFFGGAL
jgi:uncharacterized protein